MLSKKASFLFTALLFILSGVAALIYQITWFKHLSYFMGNSTYAQAVVLATFMGGLAIGSWWWGKKSDTSKNPLLLFAWLEILIGLYCFFYMPIFEGIKSVFVATITKNGWASDSGIVLLLKIVASSCAIIIPTVLMGGTLPVLVRCLSDRVEKIGTNVALLYFINSFGAIIGSVMAGFYLIDKFGLTLTTYLGAGLDLIVGIIFLVLGLQQKQALTERVKEKFKQEQPLFSLTPRQFNITLIIAGASGLCAMIYEVAWFRLLIPVLSSSTYSFSIILIAFITGITIGSLLVYYLLPKIKAPYLFLGFCQVVIVLSIIFTLPFYEKLPYYIWDIVGVNNPEGGYQRYLKIQFLLVFALIFLPTIFMGMTLPVASKISVKNISKSGQSVGNVFAINTIGTVIGSLLAGMLFIPWLGIKHTIDLALIFNTILALLVFFGDHGLNKKARLVFLLIMLFSSYYYWSNVNQKNWAASIMLSEIPRKLNRKKAPKTFQKFLRRVKREKNEIIFYKEGISGTIVVGKNNEEVFLFTNGKGDANSISDLQTQSSLGHTPVLLHPSPDSVFVIGFGAGHTIGSVMTHPEIKFAQVAEISPEVVEASVHFEHVNEQPLQDKRLQLIKDDGVAALRLSPYKYDVIISQPSNPWSAGVGNLFTKEFFSDCKKKLKPGGYVAQWFGLYEMNDKSLQLIIRTVLDQFKHVSVWRIGGNDILLICSDDPFNHDLKSMEQRYEGVKKYLGKVNVNMKTFTDFLSQQYLGSTEALKIYAGKGPLNTEDHPLLELWAPEAYFWDDDPKNFLSYNAWKNYPKSNLLLKKYSDSKGGLTPHEIARIAMFKSDEGAKGNKKFNFFYDLLSQKPNSYLPKKNKGQPEKLLIGWLDTEKQIHPLDTIHPNQKISSWTCCSDYQQDQNLNYVWTSPSGKEKKVVQQQNKKWVTAWTQIPWESKEIKEGEWNLNIYSDSSLILSQSFIVNKKAKILRPNHPHNSIFLAAKKGKELTPLTNVHPMQSLFAVTSGLAYGKNEAVHVIWTSPSQKETKMMFLYKDNYEVAWIPQKEKFPLEVGKWKVRIQSFSGKTYLKTSFIVSTDAQLVN